MAHLVPQQIYRADGAFSAMVEQSTRTLEDVISTNNSLLKHF